jgi:hypothetical protein
MTDERLRMARELMEEGQYEAAQTLLATLKPTPASIRMLAELEDLVAPPMSRYQWQYADISWRLTNFIEGVPGSYSPSDAIIHRWALIVREYAELNLTDLLLSSMEFRIGRTLDTLSETDTAAYRARFSPDALDFELFFREQPDGFRAFQPVILKELHELMEIAVKAHLMRLGAEGWELITIRERAPEIWAELHENVRLHVEELRSVYLLKRRVE